MERLYKPDLIENFHGKLMDEFHKLRGSKLQLMLDGQEFNNLIARAKRDAIKEDKLTVEQYIDMKEQEEIFRRSEKQQDQYDAMVYKNKEQETP